jgi:hypothetical protein
MEFKGIAVELFPDARPRKVRYAIFLFLYTFYLELLAAAAQASHNPRSRLMRRMWT